jgi:predicted nucleotidyltransferase component of viral defense system
MIPRQQITRRADDDGVSAPVVERDYVLTHVVEGLALAPSHEGLVFKGGTALRLCFFNDFRYSADLDFSLTGIDEQHALDVVRQSLTETAERVGFTRLELVEVPPREIHYEGPLGRTRRIKVDLAADELVLDPTPSQLLPRYPDQSDPPPSITTYSLVEVGAEKLRCVIQRLQCRDPLDLHRLLVDEGVDLEDTWDYFEQKARHKGLDPTTFGARLSQREPQYARRWQGELSEHLADVPHFE